MKNNFEYNDGFSVKKASSCILSLQLSDTGYSYSIIDPSENKYVVLIHHNFDAKLLAKSLFEKAEFLLKEEVFLSKNYKTLFFSIEGSKSTLVPKEIFDRQQIKKLYSFNQVLDEYEELHFNYIEKIESYNIFAIPSDITTLMVNKFPEVVFVHNHNVFIKDTVEKAQEVKFKIPYVHVNVNKTFFDIAIYHKDKLQVVNTYHYSNDNDFVYYILNMLEQYNIKLVKMNLNFSGFVERDTEFFYFVHQYFPTINFLKLDKSISFNIKGVEEHVFYNLLNLHNEDY